MKKFITVLALIGSVSSFADCGKTVRNAVDKKLGQASANLEVAERLVSSSGNKLNYVVDVFSQFSDGSSTEEFLEAAFSVTATGTEKRCSISKIVGIKI